ncbi:MAG TPA: transglutaminase domain-containing protein [Acidimicrobiales bacterium]|nr:transglutaminase domain-containing protein [Acidimicrobiales bacterium]
MASTFRRTVGARLAFTADGPTDVELQVAPADPTGATESFEITVGNRAAEPEELAVPGLSRVHRFSVPAGPVEVDYRATIDGRVPTPEVTGAEAVVYRRPSRYAESDRLDAVARAEFAGITDPAQLLDAVSSWVGTRLSYVPGSSLPTDGAVATLLKRQGVCRDYAHLVVALLRALDVPARLVAVYAPGLEPMDFHAVAEAAVEGRWRAVDATLLAPRGGLVRICNGRDAADTAFLSTHGGPVELHEVEVSAVVDGALPDDDVVSPVTLG